ncbi:MAG TPA: cation:proton antiporter, partial [Flavisolibacter sp.]|nr:cation:proton antiporter [Flavisolibacter sp.]
MHGYYIFTVLLLFTTLFTYINSRWVRLPVSIAVTIFSLLVSSTLLLLYNRFPELNQIIKANLDRIQFDEIVINVLLGFLLFSAAFRLNVANFTKQLPEILSLAIFSTLASTFLVGTLVYFSFHFLHQDIPFVQCLLFGSIISPTDPIAALAILGKIGISKKFELLITGESLLNDGIAIVLFLTLLNLATSNNNDTVWQDAGLLFLKEAGGALLFGLALGGLAYLLLKSLSNFQVEILVTLSVVMGGYTLARMIDVSPPLSMVVTGLVCSAGR